MQKIKTIWNRDIPKVNEIYRHFKGHIYPIIAVGMHTESKVPMVVYRGPDDQYWARELDMFLSPTDKEKYPFEKQANRFENVTNEDNIIVDKEAKTNCHSANNIEETALRAGRELPRRGEIYRHFKGGYVVVTAIATDTETGDALVVYERQGDTWIRPLDMFLSPVDTEKYPDSHQANRLERVE